MATMESRAVDGDLQALCDAAGVVTAWVDAWNRPQVGPAEDLLGVLAALLGRDLRTRSAIVAATSDLRGDVPAIEPVVVAWDGLAPPIEVRTAVTDGVVVLESGGEVPVRIDGGTVVVPPLPNGYHTLALNGGDHTAWIFAAPVRAHPAPHGVLGLISPTYSLRMNATDDVGIGTLSELAGLADVCRDAGIAVVGTLPLLAAFPDQPSPYAPASRRAWNEVFVDFDAIPDWSAPSPIPQGDPRWVDYDRTGAAIRESLASYARHVGSSPRLRAQVDAFIGRDPEMSSYARFRALADDHGRNWRAWSDGVVPDPERIAYHETVQWLMDGQLRALSSDLEARGQFLYLDLPIGCHPDGFDIWDRPELFAPASLGAPPDTLFVGGQDWGLPASIPSLSRLDGHANFRKAIARQLSVAGLLRIDHVMGIHRAWWVPHGAGATHGAYVMQPTDEMFAIICIESARAGAGVVGENLGTVPPEIRSALDEHDLLGMAVAQDGVSEPRPNDLVALSSHDTPAFAAWWEAMDVDDLLDLGVFDDERADEEREQRWTAIDGLRHEFGTDGPEDTRDALMTWMAGTPAAVALVNLDDLIMEHRRQNIPGTDWERPNWRLRHDVALDELAADDHFMDRLRAIVAARPEPQG